MERDYAPDKAYKASKAQAFEWLGLVPSDSGKSFYCRVEGVVFFCKAEPDNAVVGLRSVRVLIESRDWDYGHTVFDGEFT